MLNVSFTREHLTHPARKQKKREMKRKINVRKILFFSKYNFLEYYLRFKGTCTRKWIIFHRRLKRVKAVFNTGDLI